MRPQFITLNPAQDAGLQGQIEHMEFLGASLRYGVRVSDRIISVDAPFEPGQRVYAAGERVGLTLPLEKAIWLEA